jgi:hypothetical protein
VLVVFMRQLRRDYPNKQSQAPAVPSPLLSHAELPLRKSSGTGVSSSCLDYAH